MPSRNVVLNAVWQPEVQSLSVSATRSGSSAWVSWDELPIPPTTITVAVDPAIAGAPTVLSGSDAGFSLHGLESGVTYYVTITPYFLLWYGDEEFTDTISNGDQLLTISN
jgi:hypothetical protein